MAKQQITLRIDKDLLKRLRKATLESKRPAPTMTSMIERGIELALKEWEKRKGR